MSDTPPIYNLTFRVKATSQKAAALRDQVMGQLTQDSAVTCISGSMAQDTDTTPEPDPTPSPAEVVIANPHDIPTVKGDKGDTGKQGDPGPNSLSTTPGPGFTITVAAPAHVVYTDTAGKKWKLPAYPT